MNNSQYKEKIDKFQKEYNSETKQLFTKNKMKKAELGSFNLNADKNKKQIVENDKMIEKKEAFEHYLNQNDLFEKNFKSYKSKLENIQKNQDLINKIFTQQNDLRNHAMDNLVKNKEQEQLILSQAKQIDEIEKINEENKKRERTKLKNQLK